MPMGPLGRGASASPRVAMPFESRGSVGRARPPCFFLGAPKSWGSASPSGMGSTSSCAVGVRAKLRRDAKAGGVARASSMRARTYAESCGPSVTRPPSAASAPAVLCRVALPPAPTAAASMSASASFICWG
eukprot:4531789-Pleurochrysis_carterae.AAC.1